MITEKHVRQLALALPEAVELPHWGNPSFRVRKRIFATLREYEGLAVLKIAADDHEVLMQAMPDTFVTNAWSQQGWIGVRMDTIDTDIFGGLIEGAWSRVAPKRAIRALEQVRGAS